MMVFFIYLCFKSNIIMKMTKYISIALFLLLIGCAGDDDTSRVMRVTEVDVNDFHIYLGSAEGPVEYKYYEAVPSDKTDSLRSVLIKKYMTKYDASMYSKYGIEFNGSKIIYTFNGGNLKLIADYQFEGDSLFALNTDTSKIFVALGTQNALYRTVGISNFPTEKGDTTLTSESTTYDLDKVISLYGKSLTDPKDTIAWLNAKYLYK